MTPTVPAIRVVNVSRYGDRLLVEVELLNPTDRELFFRVRIEAPGSRVAPSECEVSVYPGQPGLVAFSVGVPAPNRLDVTAEVDGWGVSRLTELLENRFPELPSS